MNFEKLAYKIKDHRERRPQDPTPEQLTYAERVAREKLEKIRDPKFKEFSIRYVNLTEYREMLETGEFGGHGAKEVLLYGNQTKSKDIPFQVFLGRTKGDAVGAEWEYSRASQSISRDLIYRLRQVEHVNKSASHDQKLAAIRTELLNFIADKRAQITLPGWDSVGLSEIYRGRLAEDMVRRITFLNRDQLKQLSEQRFGGFFSSADESLANYLKEEKFPSLTGKQKDLLLKYIERHQMEELVGRDRINAIRALRDPGFLKQKGALRSVINALTYIFDSGIGGDHGQYQIALVFDNKTFGFEEKQTMRWAHWSSFRHWARNFNKLAPEEKKRGLLAAISIIKTKDLSQEMIKLDEGSSDFAHPVFDLVGSGAERGVLRWPR